jgi:hypothetical protein
VTVDCRLVALRWQLGGIFQPVPQVIDKIVCGRVSVGDPFGETSQADSLELDRHARLKLARRWGVSISDFIVDLIAGVAGKGPRPHK